MFSSNLLKYSLSLILPITLAAGFAAQAADIDPVQKFVGDSNFSRNIVELTQKAGYAGAPANQPWSGSYWSLDHGSIAYSYAEHGTALGRLTNLGLGFIESMKTEENHYEKRMTQIRANIDHLDAETIDRMAPSEKYDLFIGDHDFTLTANVWKAAMEHYFLFGHISPWEGSCHGWTAAASFTPRPEKSTRVMSLDGKYLIPFYPDDFKALVTLLWANSLVQDHTVMQGMRCQNKNPDFDQNSGHVKDNGCTGIDPGSFHVTLLEMVGARKTPFIIDRSNNTQVWNQPVAGYSFEYFNVMTGEKTKDLNHAVVTRAAYTQDQFAPYRDKNAVSIVGVHMVVKYVSETLPAHRNTDDTSNDNVKKLDVRYDLELDANSRIIGGEWRDSNELILNPALDPNRSQDEVNIPKFPSFIWRFDPADATIQNDSAKAFMALEVGDFDLPGSDLAQMPIPAIVAASSKSSAFRYTVSKYGKDGKLVSQRADLRPRPLSKVVNYLIEQSH